MNDVLVSRKDLLRGICLWILLLPACTGISFGQPAAAKTAWEGWQFLIGEWVGGGSGDPGQGSGGFSLLPDLQNTVLVRRNHAQYPATSGRPAFSHDDLMVVYHEKDSTRAVYFDNEQHVIHYGVAFSPDSTSLVFASDPVPSAPRFRLTYTKRGEDSLGISFEIAPPGKAEAFAPYIEATAKRKE